MVCSTIHFIPFSHNVFHLIKQWVELLSLFPWPAPNPGSFCHIKSHFAKNVYSGFYFDGSFFFSRPHKPSHPFLSSPLCLLCYEYSQPTLNVTWLRCWYSDTIFIAQCSQFYVRPLGFSVTSTREYSRPVHAQTTMCILCKRYHDINRSTSTGHLSFFASPSLDSLPLVYPRTVSAWVLV